MGVLHWRQGGLLLTLGIILIAAAYLRFVAVTGTVVDQPLRADAAQYASYAYNLKFNGTYSLDHSGFGHPGTEVAPDARRPPGYPLFLSLYLSARPTNEDLHRILLAQAGLSVIGVLLAFLLFRHLLPVSAACLAALLTALSPHLVVANVYLLTEGLFAFLTLVWLLLLVHGLRSRRIALWLALAGAVLAGSALVRPSALYLLPFLGITAYLWLPQERRERRVAVVAALLLGFALVYAPWSARNLLVLGKPSDSGLMTATLHHGTYPGLMYRDDPQSRGIPYRADPRSAEIGRDLTSVTAEIRRRFTEEPMRHLHWYLLGKPATLWQWEIIAGMGDVFIYPVLRSPYFEDGGPFRLSHDLMRELHGILLLLALLGAVVAWLPARLLPIGEGVRLAARLVTLVLLYFTALHMVAAPFPRYSVPLRPLLYGLALFGTWGGWRFVHQWFRGRRCQPRPAARQRRRGHPAGGTRAHPP